MSSTVLLFSTILSGSLFAIMLVWAIAQWWKAEEETAFTERELREALPESGDTDPLEGHRYDT